MHVYHFAPTELIDLFSPQFYKHLAPYGAIIQLENSK
jgi:hypothetical protein